MKSKVYIIFAVTICLLFAMSVSVLSAQFAGGDGKEWNPFLIETAEHLNNIRDYLSEPHYFLQIDDINLGVSPWNDDNGWVPIGHINEPFIGSYDGNGYLISNLYIVRPNSDYIGLFGYLESAYLCNVSLINVDVIGDTGVGGLAGYISSSAVAHSFSTGRVKGEQSAGGLIGIAHGVAQSHSTVQNCYSTCDVLATAAYPGMAGGLVAVCNLYSHISQSFAEGNVTGTQGVGGLAGHIYWESSIVDCYSTGDVSGNVYVGGLIGDSYCLNITENSYSTGYVTGNLAVGGLIGRLENSQVLDSYWNTETSGQLNSSGGEGRTTAEMTYPYAVNTFYRWDFDNIWVEDIDYEVNNGYPYLGWYEDPRLQFFAGGDGTEGDPFLIETAEHLYNVRHFDGCFELVADIDLGLPPWNQGNGWQPIGYAINTFSGTFTNTNYVISNLYINRPSANDIGLFGYTDNAEIDGITLVDVDITGHLNVGGLVGTNESGQITGSNVSGVITGNTNVGGLVGYNYTHGQSLPNEYSMITRCNTLADVSGNQNIGGLVGRNFNSVVSKSFAAGLVTGLFNDSGTATGGLVGSNSGASVIINSYAAGDVSGHGYLAGLVGNNEDHISQIENCYAIGAVEPAYYMNYGKGLVGRGSGDVINSYWDIEATGQTSSAGGIGRSTYDMLLSEDNYIDWIFDEEHWHFVNPNDHIREAYPILYWQDKPEEHNYAAEGHIKLYHQGIRYYWESFPRLEYQNDHNYTVDLLADLEGIVVRIESINYPHNHQIMVWDEEWIGQEIGFISKYGYQLKFSNYNQHDLYVEGTKLADETTIELFPGSETWIGYFLRETQHVFDAFGDLLDDFVSIEGEHWSMRKVAGTGMWLHQSYPPPLVEYGKMYVVKTEENLSNPYLFNWTPPSEDEESFKQRKSPEYFTFNDLPRYESIFIESIENDQDILEVAVYAGDDCVGASVFYDSYPLEILAYTGNHTEEALSFVIQRGAERGEAERVYIPQVMDPETGKYSPRILRPREQRFTVVRLGAQDEEIETIVKPKVILAQNIPNPMYWNNTTARSDLTQIPFYVPETREVTLSIYNIKGQLIKTLFSGTVNAGNHTIGWSGLNEENRQVGSGIYFYRLEAGNQTLTRKMLLVR